MSPGSTRSPIHEVRAVLSVSSVSIIIASNLKTIQVVRGVPLVDKRLSKKMQICHILVPQMISDPSTKSISKYDHTNCCTCFIFKSDTMFRTSVTSIIYKVIGS